jgi:hypothetical protein
VDESAIEARLAQAYTAAGLPPPAEVYWLNGPLELVAAWTPPDILEKIKARLDQRMLARLAPIAPAVAWKSSIAGARLEVRTAVQGDEGRAVDEAGLSTLRAAISSRIQPLLYVTSPPAEAGSF